MMVQSYMYVERKFPKDSGPIRKKLNHIYILFLIALHYRVGGSVIADHIFFKSSSRYSTDMYYWSWPIPKGYGDGSAREARRIDKESQN